MARKPTNLKSDRSDYYIPKIGNPLSGVDVFRLAGQLRSDKGSPDDARALIEQFVAESYSLEGPSHSLTVFVRDSLAEYLSLGGSLESAFRLKKGRRGRPCRDTDRPLAYATEFLRRRVANGESFEDAAHGTAEVHNTSRSVVCDAFNSHKGAALNAILEPTCTLIDLADPQQRAKLSEIFPGMPLPAPREVNR